MLFIMIYITSFPQKLIGHHVIAFTISGQYIQT